MAAKVTWISGGMVAVVVYDGDALDLAFDFEPSLDFAGAGQTGFDRGEIKPQGKADGDGGKGIADIVTAGQGDMNRSQFLVMPHQGIETAPAVNPDMTGLKVGAGMQAIGEHPAGKAGQQRPDMGIVQAGHQEAVGLDLMNKFGENFQDVVQVPVMVQVVSIDIGDNGHVGVEDQEGAVAFIGFGDKIVTLA